MMTSNKKVSEFMYIRFTIITASRRDLQVVRKQGTHIEVGLYQKKKLKILRDSLNFFLWWTIERKEKNRKEIDGNWDRNLWF